jgi:hypothetical protein
VQAAKIHGHVAATRHALAAQKGLAIPAMECSRAAQTTHEIASTGREHAGKKQGNAAATEY